MEDEQQKGERRRDRDHVEEGASTGLEHADDRGHAHVLAALERDDRAQHGEPEEQDAGQLVRPDDRLVEDVAGQDAGEQDDDLGDDERRRRDLDEAGKDRADPSRPASPRSNGRIVQGGRLNLRDMRHGCYTSLPEVFSRWVQASSPNLAFQSL